MRSLNTYLLPVAWAIAGGVMFFSAQAIVSEPVTIDPPDSVTACLPSDQGEKATLWLEPDQHGGLALRCEKHAVLAYGMAQVPTLACPIKGACDDANLVRVR